MTITYSLETSTSNLTNFKRLMFRWRGSIWQCVWKDLFVWLVIYAMLSCCYRFLLNDADRRQFEDVVHLAGNYTSAIPLTFMLGFYVSLVVNRWWEIFMNIGWPDNSAVPPSHRVPLLPCYAHNFSIAISLATYLQGNDDNARKQRRTIVRYMVLAEVLVLRDISSSVKKRFPSLEHVINAGLMTEKEVKMFEDVNLTHPKYWMPIEWCCTILRRAWKSRKLEETHLFNLVDAILQYRGNLGMLMAYDWISVPLVYTQVANLSILSYFGLCLLSSQYVVEGPESVSSSKPKLSTKDFYIPFFTILQFIFFFGWLKVAEVLINPLGEDDDDFEVNYIIDRNLQVGYAMVDDVFDELPELDKDQFWDEAVPNLPHTRASLRIVKKNENPMIGSCADISISRQMSRVVTIPEENESRSLSSFSSIRQRLSTGGHGSEVAVDTRVPDGIHSRLVSESKDEHALESGTKKKEPEDGDRKDTQSVTRSTRSTPRNSTSTSEVLPTDDSKILPLPPDASIA